MNKREHTKEPIKRGFYNYEILIARMKHGATKNKEKENEVVLVKFTISCMKCEL